MRYKFEKFEFDSESLLLTNNNDRVAIRHSEAKVLALLLKHADSILNKEDILSNAWQEKVVSEQVVFQNISQLRNRFGNNSIKTFPKRGYQWQLLTKNVTNEIQYHSSSQHSQSLHNTPQQASSSIPAKRHHYWQLTTFTCLLFIIVAAIYTQNEFKQENTDAVINLAYIPITNMDRKGDGILENISLENAFSEQNKNFNLIELPDLNTEVFTNSIEIEYPKLSKKHPFILTGKFRTHKQENYLDFMLKGPASDWQGQLSGSSPKELFSKLQRHLTHEVIYELINKPVLPQFKLANLSIAHQKSPDDLIILLKLGSSYYKTNELEKAMAMTDKLINLAKSQNNPQHIGRALLFQSKILRQKKLHELSSKKLASAIIQFEKINDLEHLWQAWFNQSLLDHQRRDYPSIKANLLKSAQIAVNAQNKLGEIEVLITLVALANNYQNHSDKYLYLQQVENKMLASQLPNYHFAEISYHYATFAKALSEKEPHLKKALKLSALTSENWLAQSSRRQLVEQYLTQNRLVEAQNLIDSASSENYNNSYLRALMAQKKQQKNVMISLAQRTFEQAQLAGNRTLSLDAALLLSSHQVNYDFYSQFIKDKASTTWRNTNESKLAALLL